MEFVLEILLGGNYASEFPQLGDVAKIEVISGSNRDLVMASSQHQLRRCLPTLASHTMRNHSACAVVIPYSMQLWTILMN
jgi:hypothetical protein